jgi:hypothetical protein
VLFSSACAPRGGPAGLDAAITLVSPAEGATVCGSPLLVETEVAGIELVDPYPPEGTEAEPGTGHIDVTLNGQSVFMTDTESFDIPDVGDAVYQLKVELAYADHSPIDPYAGDFVYVTVAEAACSPS